jgi:signal peptidase I
MARSILTKFLSLVAAAFLVAGAWVVLAPPQLGGLVRVVVVDGSSMEPVLSAGDLAVLRSGASSEVGDAVLYHDPQLGADVLHRIVETKGGRLVLKGDANSFLDDTHPSPSDVQGKLWFSIPRAGSAIAWGRQPLHVAVVVFVAALLALTGDAGRTRRRAARSATS